jgi:hypothetical protein
MDNTPAIIETEVDYTKLPETLTISANAQRSWAAVGHWKAELSKRHELKGLKLQELLLNPGTTITEIENTLASYRRVHTEMVTDGQRFRKLIDEKVLQASLTTEKEYSPKVSDKYLTTDKALTDLKVKANDAAKSTQAKQQEKLNYAAHIKNEYLVVTNELRQAALTEINSMYINYLKGKVQQPDTQAIKNTIAAMKPRAYVKYPCQYLNDDERKEIIATIPRPDFPAITVSLVAEVDAKFASYAHDLKANTVEQVELFAQQEIQDIQDATIIDTAVNKMTAQAQVPEIMIEGKKLKKTVEVVVEGTETWMLNVIGAFLRTPLCRAHVTTRKWENLTVAQMATALGKYASEVGEQDENLQYREVVK